MKPVTVYTTDYCSSCRGVKALLDKRGIAYEEVNLSRDPDSRAKLEQITGMYTFPQIVIGEQPIGGLDALIAADRSGKLPELLIV
jgi:glutaredoxin 3